MLSIVIPYYKSLKVLPRLLDSFASLCPCYLSCIEFIFVSNNSVDGSEKIIEDWVSSTGVNAILLQEHRQGVSFARNLGVKMSTKKYICFVDSDDYIDPLGLAYIFNFLINDYDALIVPLYDQDIRFKIDSPFYDSCKMLSGLWIPQFFVKTEIAKLCMFYGECFEDIGFSSDLVGRVRKSTVVQVSYYKYNQTENSITKSPHDLMRIEAANLYDRLIKLDGKFISSHKVDFFQASALYLYFLHSALSGRFIKFKYYIPIIFSFIAHRSVFKKDLAWLFSVTVYNKIKCAIFSSK